MVMMVKEEQKDGLVKRKSKIETDRQRGTQRDRKRNCKNERECEKLCWRG
jgi:hypothetical protein